MSIDRNCNAVRLVTGLLRDCGIETNSSVFAVFAQSQSEALKIQHQSLKRFIELTRTNSSMTERGKGIGELSRQTGRQF